MLSLWQAGGRSVEWHRLSLRSHLVLLVTGPATIEHLRRVQMQKWEQRALDLAKTVRGWSSCTRDKVGCVVIDPQHWDVVSTGFNDTAPGELNCGDGGCLRAGRDCPSGSPYLDDENCLHAEANGLQRAGTRARGAWLVVTRSPCGNCYRGAKTAGIARIIVEKENGG